MGFDVPMERGSTSKKGHELVMQITEKMLAEGLINMSGFSSVPEAAGYVSVMIESCFENRSREYDTNDNEVRREKE